MSVLDVGNSEIRMCEAQLCCISHAFYRRIDRRVYLTVYNVRHDMTRVYM